MRDRYAAGSHFDPSSEKGHYESWFVRANHPSRPLALWVRSTIFAPRAGRADATSELWAVWFDGERDQIAAVREDVPLARSLFSKTRLDVRIGEAVLVAGAASGRASRADAAIEWDLALSGPRRRVPLLPALLYRLPFPQAKSVTLETNLRVGGTVRVAGDAHTLEGYLGSVSHNWGPRHTDFYAWAQVGPLDGASDAFFECITGQVFLAPRLGIRTPWLTVMALHLDGRVRHLASAGPRSHASSPYALGDARFVGHAPGLTIEARIRAPTRHFVGLAYRNPIGGVKVCHNTKIASAKILVDERGRKRRLQSANGAALEILSDELAPGVRLAVGAESSLRSARTLDQGVA